MKREIVAGQPNFVTWIRCGVLGLGFVAILALSYDVATFTSAVDDRAHHKEIARVRNGIFVLGEATVAEHLVLANSPETFEHVDRQRDASWIKEEFWPRAALDDGEYALLVSADGLEIISSSPGNTDDETKKSLLEDAAPFIAKVRADFETARGKGEPDDLFPGLYVHGLASVNAAPSIVSVIAISPARAAAMSSKAPLLLLHATPINARIIRDLGEIALVPDIRFVATAAEPSGADDSELALDDSSGRAFAKLVWARERPGRSVLAAILPVVLLSCFVILLQAFVTNRTFVYWARRLIDREARAVGEALTDAATGLANRRRFQSVFAELAQAHREQLIGVALVDLDYFKKINDTMGHAAGDAVLAAVAMRLQSFGERTIIAARLGGDEFAIVTGPLADRAELSAFCAKLLNALRQPAEHEGQQIQISASIGAALCPLDGNDVGTILASADLALYRAKRDGRGCARVYDPDIDPVAALKAVSDDAAQPKAESDGRGSTRRFLAQAR